MKTHRTILFLLIAASLAVTSCRSRTDKSEGTVILTAETNTFPVTVSLSSTDPGVFQLSSFTLHSIIKDPTMIVGTELQTIEMRSFTVNYRRRDTGTRVPAPIVRGLSGNVPPGSNLIVTNLPFLTYDQLLSPPLK